MRVVIIQNNNDLGQIWKNHLERQGCVVSLCSAQSDAIQQIRFARPDVIVLSIGLIEASALAISDFAAYHLPATKVIFVSNDSFFSDGSIFAHASNACAFVAEVVPPEDLCALVEFHGSRVSA